MPNVKIRIEKGQQQAGDGNLNTQGSEQSKSVAVTSIFAHQMLGTAKQIVSYAANNVGNYTGDYIQQSKINQGLETVSDLATISAGIMAGGWVGGIVAVAGITTKKVFQYITDTRNDILAERDREYMLARSGNSTTNGSRGTEN